MSEFEIQTIREVIAGLIRNRDELGLMVENARGNVSDEYMEGVFEERFRQMVPVDDADLLRKTEILARFVNGDDFDSELVSAVFNVDYLQAMRVVDSLRRRVSTSEANAMAERITELADATERAAIVVSLDPDADERMDRFVASLPVSPARKLTRG